MKIRTETIVVPEETYVETHYTCELCEFETGDEEDADRHHALQHAAKKEVEVGGTRFYWFDTTEDAHLFAKHREDRTDSSSVQWDGPGWYGQTTRFSTGGCRCGGCERFDSYLQPVSDLIEERQKEIANHEKTIATLQAVVATLQTMSPSSVSTEAPESTS